MQITFNIIMLFCLIAIPASHVLALLISGFARLINTVGIFLHVLALMPLIYFGAELELIYMLFMLSLVIKVGAYVVRGFVLPKLFGVKKAEEDGEV